MKNKTILNQLVKISYLEEKNEDLILSDNFLRQNQSFDGKKFELFMERHPLPAIKITHRLF